LIPDSAIARTQRCLDGIAARNAEVNAFLHVLQEGALVQAEASDHRRKADRLIGPLDGVIVALKDNMDLAGWPTSGGIGHYRASVAQADATVVAQLKAAGAVIIGKTHMQEAALGASGENPWFGRCNNPLREGYSPGGSSSGSAAAVAAGWCELGLGSDTMGSVRIPAAYCGVAGFIPSRGSLSLEGVMPLAPSLDQVGWIAASTHLLASAWQALGGASPRISTRADLQGLRIGIATDFPAMSDSGPMRDLMERARTAAQGAGAALVDISLSSLDLARIRRDAFVLCEMEGAAVHRAGLAADPEGFSAGLRKMFTYGARQGPESAAKVHESLRAATVALRELMRGADALLLPTTADAAFAHGTRPPETQADFTTLANIAGLPAASIPFGADVAGMPLGLQILAPHGEDARVLQIAALLAA
jgi:aspartyl-tRNA(Asn)/glutamyl-tRNA(Gln) amidotransferase subunit A